MIKRSNVDGFSKRENFVENSLSLQSTESPCSLLSIGTFRSKFSRKSSTIDFCRLKLLGLELLGLYTRNCNKFLRLIFYAYVCQRALIFFYIESGSFQLMNKDTFWLKVYPDLGVGGGGGICPLNFFIQKNYVSIPTWNLLTFPFWCGCPCQKKNCNISYCPPPDLLHLK